MRNYSRFIPGEEIDAVEHWSFGALDTAAQMLAAQVKARESQEDDAKSDVERQQSYQTGYIDGLVQGRAQADAELQQKMQDFLANQAQESGDRLAQLFASAQAQLEQAEQTMAQGVLDLSCELARQVLRHEFAVNPNVLMPVIREALGLLNAENKSAVIRMNPADVDAVEEPVRSEFAGLDLSLRADPAVLPGGCLVESAGMVVDGSVDKRWQRAVATLGLSSAWEVPDEPD